MALRKGSKVKYKVLDANKPKKKYWSEGVVEYKWTGGTPRRTVVSVNIGRENETYILVKKDVKRRRKRKPEWEIIMARSGIKHPKKTKYDLYSFDDSRH